MKSKILILPSWYSTAEAPTSGSFFHEQSLLLENSDFGIETWDVNIITTEKTWISRQRHWFYKLFPTKIPQIIGKQFLSPPLGNVVHYPFCKYISDEENLNREVQSILHFFQEFPNEKPDLIHGHSTYKGGILAKYLARELNIPFLITEHMNPFLLHTYSDFWKTEIKNSLEKASAVLAVSEHQKQQLLMHNIKCNPIVTGNLVDDSRFLLPKKSNNNEIINFLIVTFYPNFIKDMDTFFHALTILKNEQNIGGKQFTIVGGGEISGEFERNYYQSKIEELNLQNWVSIVPKANRTEMVSLMQKTDALISTSIAETFGVAICEAMLCGKPVITTRNGGVNDYISEENAITIPIKNPFALSEAIVGFAKTKTIYNPQIIRNNISENYGRKTFRKRIDEIYINVLKQP